MGCGFPNFDFRAVDAGAPCTPAATSVDYCRSLPRYTGGAPADPFCDVPSATLDAKNNEGVVFYKGATAASVPEKATVKAAADDVGLHVHVHVVDASIVVAPDPVVLHEGDAFEVFAAAFVPTKGDFDATSDIGATHFIFAPPTSTIGARAIAWQSRCDVFVYAPVDASDYSAKLVADGWEMDLAIPWSQLGAPPSPTPTSGARIALTIALDAQDDPSTKGRQMQAFLGQLPVSPPSSSCVGCSQANGVPFCDDRTWCTPTLQ